MSEYAKAMQPSEELVQLLMNKYEGTAQKPIVMGYLQAFMADVAVQGVSVLETRVDSLKKEMAA
jgi:hypothetical protein